MVDFFVLLDFPKKKQKETKKLETKNSYFLSQFHFLLTFWLEIVSGVKIETFLTITCYFDY